MNRLAAALVFMVHLCLGINRQPASTLLSELGGDNAMLLIGLRHSEPSAFRCRKPKMVTLQVANTCCAHKGRVLGTFDAFGDGSEAKAFNEIDQIAQNALLRTARRQIANVGLVDLDHVHRQMLKMAQRGVAGAEIVHGDPAAYVVQRVDKARRRFDVVQGSGLCDFHNEPTREIGPMPKP